MNILRIFSIIALSLIFQFTAMAQEQLQGLMEQPHIIQYLKDNGSIQQKNDKSTFVKMPVADDFSTYYGYPDNTIWADSFVFVSDGFARNNLTIGSVIFDAFNEEGQMYSGASSFPFKADYLTSLPVRLDSVFTGTPHVATPADSVYLSFFYQPQGWGDKPETDDSLVVQLYNPVLDEWNTVWASPGMSYQQFKTLYGVDYKSVMIPITNADYFTSEFRFRFYNIVSLANNAFPTWAGNVDLWTIDYVYLNAGRNMNDTFPVDVAFRQRQMSLLKDYHSMPWSHFIVNPTSNMAALVALPYKNYSNVLLNLTEQLIITDLSGTTSGYNSGISASNLDPLQDTIFSRTPFPYIFNSTVSENAEFLTRFIINSATIPDMVGANDTVFSYQRFYNYFSYDDGTPEAGYGLIGTNAQLAYKFTLSHPDTLRAVQMQFNRVLNNVNENYYFNLRVWNEIAGKPGDVIYEELGLRPVVNGFYGFHNYVLQQAIPVSGNIYVGWKQQDSEALNLGYDRNTNRSDRVFYNTDGQWLTSLYEGTLMMRIIVGSDTEPYVDISGQIIEDTQWLIVPNPSTSVDGFRIDGISEYPVHLQVFSTEGRKVYESMYDGAVIYSDLAPGIYIVLLSDSNKGTSSQGKLIISE